MNNGRKPRVLVFIVAYNAEKTISSVVRRIPADLANSYELEVLIIDDASRDLTFAAGHHASKAAPTPFPIRVLFNPVNQGYGGNQKLGYRYAIENQYDFVALLHGDGQYAPECLPELLEPLRNGDAAAVFGSRMLNTLGALKGGMPLYKFVGNRILTWIENRLLSAHLSEFHSGYRLYSVSALRVIPFERNSNGFHFDTEIIIQLLIARLAIVELPIPTHYGDEVCHVNGLRYARNVISAALKARLQRMSLLYDRRFDCSPADHTSTYRLKLGYASPHTLALKRVRSGSRVMDLGCAGGYMCSVLKQQKRCFVSVVGRAAGAEASVDEVRIHDLNDGVPEIPPGKYDVVLMLDAIEHLAKPEAFLEELREVLAFSPSTEFLISTGNVGFLITRIMLLFGQFNYGKRGILDLTHTRLFTFASLKRALEQAGFTVFESCGVPAPFPLAVGNNLLSRALLSVNQLLIRVSRGLFSYQIFMRVKAQPTVKSLLKRAEDESYIRAYMIEEAAGAGDPAIVQYLLKHAGGVRQQDRRCGESGEAPDDVSAPMQNHSDRG